MWPYFVPMCFEWFPKANHNFLHSNFDCLNYKPPDSLHAIQIWIYKSWECRAIVWLVCKVVGMNLSYWGSMIVSKKLKYFGNRSFQQTPTALKLVYFHTFRENWLDNIALLLYFFMELFGQRNLTKLPIF